MQIKNLSVAEKSSNEVGALNFYYRGEKIVNLSETVRPLDTFITAVPLYIKGTDSVVIDIKKYDQVIVSNGEEFTSRAYVIGMAPHEGEIIERRISLSEAKSVKIFLAQLNKNKDKEDIGLRIIGFGVFYLVLYYKKEASMNLQRPDYMKEKRHCFNGDSL